MKFKRNPSASPVFSKTSPTRQEVDPPASETEFQQIDIYNQLYDRQAPEIRQDLGRKAEGAVTTIEKKNEGMQLVFDAIKSGADKKEITKIVREHNRDLYGSVESGEVVKHKGFADARIGLKEAFGYMPKTVDKTTRVEEKKEEKRDDVPREKWDDNLTITDQEGNITGRVVKNPNYIPNFKGPVSELKETNEYILSRNISQNNPIPKKGFKMPGFGKRK